MSATFRPYGRFYRIEDAVFFEPNAVLAPSSFVSIR